MRITITIPDEVAEEAKAKSLTPESYVEKLIELAEPGLPASTDASVPRRDMQAFFREMAMHSDILPRLPDEAFNRESFYQDHD